ncbi:MAG: hypothetical protein ACPGOY_09590 [Rhodospirillaceae bacterium]
MIEPLSWALAHRALTMIITMTNGIVGLGLGVNTAHPTQKTPEDGSSGASPPNGMTG